MYITIESSSKSDEVDLANMLWVIAVPVKPTTYVVGLTGTGPRR